jgi:S-adenosylmethionine:tRNA ribosyltransferase-isomerase
VDTEGSSTDVDLCLSSYDYKLPEGQIAQYPVTPRDSARLLVVDSTQSFHSQFRDLPSWLRPGDLLVLNNTRVIPARLFGCKRTQETFLTVEVLLLEEQSPQTWLALVKPGRRLKPGAIIEFGPLDCPCLKATVLATDVETRGRLLQFELPAGQSLAQVLENLGQVPLPPYIQASTANPEQYQTIYGDRPGAVAAPTAGLHFTETLLERLQDTGIHHSFITLHVGVGTFRPVEVENITRHTMHGERIEVNEATVAQIRQTQAAGGRVIAVGTTVARTLEAAAQTGQLQPFAGKTELFIYPGYQWQVVDGLITNFHLPRSSLLMLVSALVGRQRLMDLYQTAIAAHYRFYSFGDAMLILPEARMGEPA